MMKIFSRSSGSCLQRYRKALLELYITEKNISVEMKLVIILLGISQVLGYEETYKGFNECGLEGWTCVKDAKEKYEITYTCPKHQPNARVWIWTARLPNGASTFIVRDCNHLEVHLDCTKGYRSTILRQFKVINVTNLELLPPLLPGVFLHDNDQVPQVPAVFHVSNVKNIKLYPGVFDKPGGGCRYKFIELASLILENVRISRMMKDLFHNQVLSTLVMKDVVIDAFDSNAVNIAAQTTIMGTTFPNLPANALNIRGESISFISNTFKRIQTNGLTIRSKEFNFTRNHVEEINTQGMDVLGAKIKITNNVFNHLETGAFQKITPGYSPSTYEVASKFVYNFSENLIKNINPGSIHLNWEVYKKVCSEIIFKKNLLECSCINLGWMSVSNGLGPKITKVKEFYDMYLNTEDNICNGHNGCPLNAVITEIQDVCSKKTNVSTICSTVASAPEVFTSTSPNEVTVALSNTSQETTEEQVFLTEPIEITDKIIPVLSYTENQTSQLENTGFPIYFAVIPALVILAAVCLGTFTWWYKRKKQRQAIMTIYKNEKGADADNLIMINEHHNELFNKQ